LPGSSPEPARNDRFTALYEAHYHRIAGYARRRSSRDDALDIVAETFTIAWRRFEEVPEGDRALYWLYATARRVLANHRRTQRRRANLIGALEAQPREAATPPAALEHRRVAAALAHLPEAERELLLLFAWEGLDAAGIASVVRCSRNAARIRLHRARRRFARALAAKDDELKLDDDVKRENRGGHVVSAAEMTATVQLEDRP
jgi:RNA polymerase sigma factor (sigma-70 family)